MLNSEPKKNIDQMKLDYDLEGIISILDKITSDHHDEAAKAAAEALIELRDIQAIEPLVSLLQRTYSESIDYTNAWQDGTKRIDKSISKTFHFSGTVFDTLVNLIVAQGINGIRYLKELRDKHSIVKTFFFDPNINLVNGNGLDAVMRKVPLESLVSLLQDDDKYVSMRASAHFGRNEVQEQIINLLTNIAGSEAPPYIRQGAQKALKDIKKAQTLIKQQQQSSTSR